MSHLPYSTSILHQLLRATQCLSSFTVKLACAYCWILLVERASIGKQREILKGRGKNFHYSDARPSIQFYMPNLQFVSWPSEGLTVSRTYLLKLTGFFFFSPYWSPNGIVFMSFNHTLYYFPVAGINGPLCMQLQDWMSALLTKMFKLFWTLWISLSLGHSKYSGSSPCQE